MENVAKTSLFNKKYEFTGETKQVNGVTVNRIRLIGKIEGYKKGDLVGKSVRIKGCEKISENSGEINNVHGGGCSGK